MGSSPKLDAARAIDWRFLLPTPALERVALLGTADAGAEEALTAVGVEAVRGSIAELAGGEWDVVVAGQLPAADRGRSIGEAFGLVRSGGWLLTDLPARAGVRGQAGPVMRALMAAGAERVERHWFVPDRVRALRVVPLDDRAAEQHVLSRHGSRMRRRVRAALAIRLLHLGVSADSLGGTVALFARRQGGPPVSGWPSIEPFASTIAREYGLNHPSWILLTPRFPASAHVVLLLLRGGEVRLVVKIARLAGDDGPLREATVLEALAARGMRTDAVPRLVAATTTSGHAALVEEAVAGNPLDRAVARADPARWIGVAREWLSRMPSAQEDTVEPLEHVVRRPLERLRDEAHGDTELAALASRTLQVLEPLEHEGLPRVFEHGDFGHPNLLVRTDGGLSVVDWELARPDGMPLHDLTFFLGYLAFASGRDARDPFASFVRVLGTQAWGASDALRAEVHRLGLNPEFASLLVVACWARTFASLVDRLGLQELEGRPGGHRSNRYYLLWKSSIERHDQVRVLLT